MLSFNDVSFAYEEENWVVKDLNFDIQKGELVTLLGKNGSGKSTIARLANGLLTPQKGAVTLDGIKVSSRERVNEIKSKIGIVFQNPDNQFIGMTVEEDLAFGLENLNIPRENAFRMIEEMSEQMGISQFLHFPPNLLSGGEKQKIAIASALVLGPSFLILDEVTSLLDPVERALIMKIVKNVVTEKNVGIIYITHNPEEAIFSDKVIIIDEGRIDRIGETSTLLTDVEYLNNIDISAPPSAVLSHLLKEKGILKRKYLSLEEILKEIC